MLAILVAGAVLQPAAIIRSVSPGRALVHVRDYAAFVRDVQIKLWSEKKFQVDRNKLYLFNATLGFPGEGPGKDEAKLNNISGAYADMEAAHEEKIREICNRDSEPTRTRATAVRRVVAQSPALFFIFLQWSCCLSNLPTLTSSVALLLWYESLRYVSRSQKERNNESLFYLNSIYRRDTGELGQMLVLGYPVCPECYRQMYGLSTRTFDRWQELLPKGVCAWEHGNTGNLGSYTGKGWESRQWMKDFFYTIGDFQPDTCQVHLPPMDKQDVYAEMTKEAGDWLSASAFLRVWREEFTEVRIPAQQRLGKCEECKHFHEEIMATKDVAARKVWKSERHKHLEFVKAERMEYHKWRIRARNEPAQVLCVIIEYNP